MDEALEKKDNITHNLNAADFIPVACHYDKDTVITKNGDLIQTIHIHGIYSQSVNNDLVNLRKIIRETIKKNVDSADFAFWIQTISRKTDLDDSSLLYPDLLSANIHNIWRDKNYWNDKFVNTLYISVVYRRPNVALSTFNTFINSLSVKTLEKFHDDYFRVMAEKLHKVVDNILKDLDFFGVRRLTVVDYSDGDKHSEIMFLYRSIVNLNEGRMPIPIEDFSTSLATHNYVVGNTQMQVRGAKGLTFASILSIKEYHGVSSEYVENVLRLPVEFIATEVLYFIPKGEAVKDLEHTNYILNVSGNPEILDERNISDMMNLEDRETNFCKQQLNIMVINQSKEGLENDVRKTSESLSVAGIVHVLEDINLEQTFWSQLPGNFTFLRRAQPITYNEIGAMSSLYNFPTGDATNPWGRAVTLLRTSKGSPYFMNFHDNRKIGHSCIFGPNLAGKTVLINFLVSESMRFLPTMVYMSTNKRSTIFLDAIGALYMEYNPADLKIEQGQNTAFDFEGKSGDEIFSAMTSISDYFASMEDKKPKMLVIDNITSMLNNPEFRSKFPDILDKLTQSNAIMLFSLNLTEYAELKDFTEMQKIWDEKLGCYMLLPGEDEVKMDMRPLLNFTDAENAKAASFPPLSRLFLMKQNGLSTVLEFSFGGFPGIIRMLSSSERDIETYKNVKAEYPDQSDGWVIPLYQKLNGNKR